MATQPRVADGRRDAGGSLRRRRAENDVLEAAAANPRLYRSAKVWIDVGTGDPFRDADTELARRLSACASTCGTAGTTSPYFEHHASEILSFYAAALARC